MERGRATWRRLRVTWVRWLCRIVLLVLFSGLQQKSSSISTKSPFPTLATANINMSKLDSAYDIDPLFHKMSKSFDEGGAKGLLLGNLGVSSKGCHIVFDSKEEFGEEQTSKDADEQKLEGIDEENEEDTDGEEEERFNIDPEDAVVWKESEIDITSLAVKLENMLHAYGAKSSDSVPFVPQLESLRNDYAALEEEGFAVDEKDASRGEGRRRQHLYDAPEEEEKEAEKSIHHIAMERSRGSVLGMSFDTNFRLSLDSAEGGRGEFAPMEDDDEEDFGGLGGDGEFAPDDFGGDGEFAPDFGDDGGNDSPGNFTDRRSYNNTKVLLDALCDGNAFYEDGSGGNSDYAFFDMKKFEKATDGNLWAGASHWKKVPGITKKDAKTVTEKRKVTFGDDEEDGIGAKDKKKRAVKKDRLFVCFTEVPNVDAIFEKKKGKRTTKKTPADPFQMPKTDKNFLLPPDANVDISQLTRLFSRPNAVVRRPDNDATKPAGKTVGFYDVEDNALGFDDNNDVDFGGDNDGGGFTFAYGNEDDQAGDDVDYHTDNFDEVRKVEKIDITYATVAKKVDVRRLKKDLWAELEEKTALVPPEEFTEKDPTDDQDDIYADPPPRRESKLVSFKETVEKMDNAQSQNDVTVSFYFICCLHLANEKGLKLESTGLDDFMIGLDDGSAPTFGTFGDGFTETANKLSIASSRNKREQKKDSSYTEEGDIESEEESALGA